MRKRRMSPHPMSNRSISLTDSLYDYLLSVSLREPDLLLKLREETAADPAAQHADLARSRDSSWGCSRG